MSFKNAKRVFDCSSTLRVYESATYNIPFLGLMNKKGIVSPKRVYEMVYDSALIFFSVSKVETSRG